MYVVGSTFVDGNGALILKFSSTGSLLWQRTWGGNAAAAGVAVGSDGSAYVTGASRSIGAGEQDVFVLRLSPDGALVWARTWGSAASNEEGQGIALGPDGTVHVAAVAPRGEDPFAFRFDAVVLALDADGNLLRQRAYPAGDQTDARGGIAVAADGAVYVAGGLQEPSGSSFANDGLLLKIASDGSLVWARSSDIGFFDAITVAPDGHVVVVGQTSADPGGDAFLLRVGTDGRTATAIGWGGAGLDAGRGADVAADGTLSLAAVAEQPPYLLASASGRTSRARVSVTTPVIPLATATAPLADPAGLVETPAGSTTYAGGFEAALVRLAP